MSFQTAVSKKKIEIELTPRCKLGDIRIKMNNEDRDALDYAIQWVRDEKASQAWLVKALNDNGFQVGKTVVRDHLREECACVASS